MEISKAIIKKLEEIAEYYSFENDPCSIETALRISINHELKQIEERKDVDNENNIYKTVS